MQAYIYRNICNVCGLLCIVNAVCGEVAAECGSCDMWELLCVEVVVCGNCYMWELRCVGIAVCGNCGVWEKSKNFSDFFLTICMKFFIKKWYN